VPLVLVELLSGRSDEQLRRFTTAVTDAVVDILDADPGSVVVRFCEYAPSRMGSGGVLAADKVRQHRPAT
jgi:4-oxalocrotonate tautomerase family enzyme